MKKVVIIGPESTGKSTLANQLAEHYNTTWCPEFAREYLLEHGRDYNFDDLLNIARGQVELERATEPKLIRSPEVGKDTAAQVPATAISGQSGTEREPASVGLRSGRAVAVDVEWSIPPMPGIPPEPMTAIGSAPIEGMPSIEAIAWPAPIPSISAHVVDAHRLSA